MNKEEEEFIKERERNRELMEEIAREIEMTCLGKLKKIQNKLAYLKTLDEQVLPRELQALLNSLTLWDSWECSIWNSADFTFLKPLTLNPFSLYAANTLSSHFDS